jgi:hypothetical protein
MKLLLAAERAATSSAGHEVDRSVSPRSLDASEVNRKDKEAQRDRVAQVIPLHQAKTVIARPQVAQNSFKASLLASTATQHLRSSAFIRGSKSFVPQAAPAGHGLHRPVSSRPLDATPTPRRRAA